MNIKKIIKGIVKCMPGYSLCRNNIKSSNWIELFNWKKEGRPIPPPYSVKRKTIKKYAKLFSCKTFVETGTLFGDTVFDVRSNFKRIISVELDTALYEKAKNRFLRFPNIKILHGDSGSILPKVLLDISGKCLFWLDGHYCGGITAKGNTECPVMQELKAILSRKPNNDVILIDDARCYVGKGDWPDIEELRKLVSDFNQDLVFEIKEDIIRIHGRI